MTFHVRVTLSGWIPSVRLDDAVSWWRKAFIELLKQPSGVDPCFKAYH